MQKIQEHDLTLAHQNKLKKERMRDTLRVFPSFDSKTMTISLANRLVSRLVTHGGYSNLFKALKKLRAVSLLIAYTVRISFAGVICSVLGGDSICMIELSVIVNKLADEL